MHAAVQRTFVRPRGTASSRAAHGVHLYHPTPVTFSLALKRTFPPTRLSVVGALVRRDDPTRGKFRTFLRSCVDLRDDLRRVAAGQKVHAHRESIIETVARFVSTYRTAIWLVLAYLVMRVSIMLWRGI